MSLIGVGQVFGDDDVIQDRQYKASLKCTQNDSFVYTIVKVDFLRFFKKNGEAWTSMWSLSQLKHVIDS
jgi:hypothetical protein